MTDRAKYALLAISIALLIPACRAGTPGGESWTRESGLPSATTQAAQTGEIKDPIAGMLVATSIDDKGHMVNPKFTFDPTEPQITVLVQVGKITKAPLDLVWYQVTVDGAQRLFAHQVQVDSYDRAYSIGKNPGLLASGAYAVVATLAGQTKLIEFDVRQKAGQRTESGTPASERDERWYTTGGAPWLLASTRHQVVSTLAGQTKTIAFEAASPTGSSPAPTQPGNPPVDGGSGKTTSPSSNAPSSSECEVLFYNFLVEDQSTVANLIDIIADNASCPLIVELTASVDGPPVTVGYMFGPGKVAFYVDPCSLPGGKDLPGTKVRFAGPSNSFFEGYRRRIPSPFIITLGDDTSAPRLDVVSTPARGAKVKPGDKISLKIKANEVRSGQSWQSGVMDIQVIADPGGLVTSKDYMAYRGKACNEKSWEQSLDAMYTVPNDPPPIIKLCALTDDFAGNQNTKCGEFRTGNKWNGRVHLVSSISDSYGKSCNNETWDGEFSVVVAANGQVQGKGSAHEVTPPQCNFRYPPPATLAEFDVRGIAIPGAFDWGKFQLAFAQTGALSHGYAIATFLWDPYSLSASGQCIRSPEDFTVPVIAPGDAEAQVSNSIACSNFGNNPSTSKGQMTITMLCEDCK